MEPDAGSAAAARRTVLMRIFTESGLDHVINQPVPFLTVVSFNYVGLSKRIVSDQAVYVFCLQARKAYYFDESEPRRPPKKVSRISVILSLTSSFVLSPSITIILVGQLSQICLYPS